VIASAAKQYRRAAATLPSRLLRRCRSTPRNDDLPAGLGGGGYSIRFRQAEDALGDVAQDQLRADRGDAGDLDLAEIAFDMVLAGIAHAAMGHDCCLAGAKAGLGGAVFGGIGIGAGLLPAIVGG